MLLNTTKKRSCLCFVGDGGTSEGDFHEAISFAGVWKIPVILSYRIISMVYLPQPGCRQHLKTWPVKAVAYGVKGIKVDGNDYFAMYKTIQESIRICEEGEGRAY